MRLLIQVLMAATLVCAAASVVVFAVTFPEIENVSGNLGIMAFAFGILAFVLRRREAQSQS